MKKERQEKETREKHPHKPVAKSAAAAFLHSIARQREAENRALQERAESLTAIDAAWDSIDAVESRLLDQWTCVQSFWDNMSHNEETTTALARAFDTL